MRNSRRPYAPCLGAVRTYTHGGAPIAVHSSLPGGGTSYLFNDPHGTSTLAMDVANQQLTRKQQKPYGEDRAAVSQLAWPDMTHGYLGKSKDGATGYTDLGARKYDPTLGSFISADPLLETSDPNQLGGYTYAGDNPIAGSDASNLVCMMEDHTSCGPPQTGKGSGGNTTPGGSDSNLPKATAKTGTNDAGKELVCISGYYCMDHYQVTDFAGFVDQYYAELARLRSLGGNAPDDVIFLQAMAAGCYNGDAHGHTNCDGITTNDLRNASGMVSTSARDDPDKLAHNIENFATATADPVPRRKPGRRQRSPAI